MSEPVIELDEVSKSFKIYRNRRHRAVEMLVPGAPVLHTDFWALRGVSLRLERGETLGVVGANGSGKSTLLQIIAGIVRQTGGRVSVQGRVSSLLELGAGFHPELTGRENVEVFCTIIGLSRAEIRGRLPDIERFAGIGEFIDQPVKVYSSGMFVRLAFAAAIHVDPDILLVDEALAVGDAVFQHQCLLRIRELQSRGTTVVFVSHDMGMVKAISSRVVLLDAGRIIAQGDPAEMASLYFARASAAIAKAHAPHDPALTITVDEQPRFQTDATFDARARVFRHGTGAARIRSVELLDACDRPTTAVEFNDEAVLRVHAEYLAEVPTSIIGFGFRDRTGTELIGTNTHEEGIDLPPRRAGSTLVVDFRLRIPLTPGTYSVSSAIAPDRYTRAYFDWVDNALVLTVSPPSSGKAIHGQVWVPVNISVHPS
jgi:ABC-type polysaccharide/polyol phosphate transport system ATPase subunit